MEIFSRLSFIILSIIVSLVQTNGVAENSISVLDVKTNSISLEPPIETSTCPNASTILPCTCTKTSYGIAIDCSDSAVDQTSIENSFRELRRVNEIPEDRGFSINQLTLYDTELTQFDLAPLYASRMDLLDIRENGNLTKWVTSGNPQDHRSIHVDTFIFTHGPINGDEFGDTLKYFSVEMTGFAAITLTINNSNNTDEFGFLPELSAFVNLKELQLDSCNISGRLNKSHLKAFPRLRLISLSHNEIDEIGENVFLSDVRVIYLIENKLNQTSFHPESGIAQPGGSQKTLYLDSNQITTLPSEIFQTFLDAHLENELSLSGNPLFCDERLSWIKSRREEFQYRVDGAYCSNDPDHTVFTSDLIP